MGKNKPTSEETAKTSLPMGEKPEPNILLQEFLDKNNLKFVFEAVEGENPFVGSGFIITDKPLLKVSVTYK